MNDWITALSLDWKNGVLFIAALLILVVFVLQKTDWLYERFGLTTKRKLMEEQQKKDIEELKAHAKKTDDNFDKISQCMEEVKTDLKEVAQQVTKMQKRINENNISKMGDRLIQGFRYYNERKQWTSMEKWAFDNLAKSYLDSGGNSYVEEFVIPESKTWKVIDQ